MEEALATKARRDCFWSRPKSKRGANYATNVGRHSLTDLRSPIHCIR